MANNREPIRSGLASLTRERRQPEQSRLAKLLSASVTPASTQLSDTDDLDELEEEDVWAADGRDGGSVIDAEPVRRSSNFTPLRIVTSDRHGAAAWGIGDNGRRQRSTEKDSSPFGVPVGRRAADVTKNMNGFSANSPQENGSKSPSGRRSSREGTPRRIPTASRMIPRGAPFEETARRAIHQSAPMNIPDWSKILKVEKLNKPPIQISDDDREDEDEERLPPHELLSREYARSQMTSFSVFEGVGRTLRGRDLSRVRNAVLTRTGFLE